jgi:hypothetical protein
VDLFGNPSKDSNWYHFKCYRPLVILLLITSLVTGIMSHVPLAGVVPFQLGLAFEVTVFESHSQSAVDVPLSSPFVDSLASRAPPLF